MEQDSNTPPTTAERLAKSDVNRQARLVGRQALRRITLNLACHDCGRQTINSSGAVDVRRTSAGVVGFAGLASCGNIWLCPVCNAKVMARRSLEIGVALSWAQREGFNMLWGSLTVRHNAQSDLKQLLDLQRKAWRGVINSKFWKAANATETTEHVHTRVCGPQCDRKQSIILTNQPGRIGYIRASELTIGKNGWHPHFHPLIFWRGTRAAAQAFADKVVAEWVYQVERHGGEAREEGGQQLRVISSKVQFESIGDYVMKQTFDHSAIAMELVWSQNKTGWVTKGRAAKTEPHWSLLAKIALGPGSHIAEVDRWAQLEDGIPFHRMISWSRGLREFAQLGTEVSDEEIVAEEVGTANDSVCFILPEGWVKLRDEPEQLALILSTLAASGWSGLRVLLDGLRVPYAVMENV